ncbi:MAG: hypothetical protein H7124_17145 [Phycisphaerales bacterium]|nr:hypothetical protein [Hyphomonadaceae bacterium]
MIASAWTVVEEALIDMFSAATGQSTQMQPGVVTTTFNPVSFATLRAIENLHLRLTVVKAAMAQHLPPDLKQEFEDLAKEMRRRAGDRNDVVHGAWGMVDAYPNDVLLRGGDVPFSGRGRDTRKRT